MTALPLLEREVLVSLQDHGVSSVHTLGHRLQRTPLSVRQSLAVLAVRGLVETTDGGWQLRVQEAE